MKLMTIISNSLIMYVKFKYSDGNVCLCKNVAVNENIISANSFDLIILVFTYTFKLK